MQWSFEGHTRLQYLPVRGPPFALVRARGNSCGLIHFSSYDLSSVGRSAADEVSYWDDGRCPRKNKLRSSQLCNEIPDLFERNSEGGTLLHELFGTDYNLLGPTPQLQLHYLPTSLAVDIEWLVAG